MLFLSSPFLFYFILFYFILFYFIFTTQAKVT
jgi:cbb3-type cytochrome oxidase subunit 3